MLYSAGWGGWVGENRLGVRLAGSGILGHSFFHPRDLFVGGGDAMARFPCRRRHAVDDRAAGLLVHVARLGDPVAQAVAAESGKPHQVDVRSEEHTSELPSLMRIPYAVFCLKKKKPK